MPNSLVLILELWALLKIRGAMPDMTDLFCGFKGLLDPVHPHHRDDIRMGSIDGDPKKKFLADGTFRGLSYR